MKTMTRKWIKWQAAKPRSQWTSTQPKKIQIVYTLTHNMMPFLLLWGTSLVGLIFSLYAFVFSERSLFYSYSNSIGQNPENSVSNSPKKQILCFLQPHSSPYHVEYSKCSCPLQGLSWLEPMQAGHWSLTDQDGAEQSKGSQRQDAGRLKPNPCGRGSNMNNNQATKGAAIWCQFPLYFSSSQMVIAPHRSKCAQRFNLTLYWLDLIVGVLKDTLPLSGNTEVVVENWGLVMGIWSQLSRIKTEHADLALTNIRISRYFRI